MNHHEQGACSKLPAVLPAQPVHAESSDKGPRTPLADFFNRPIMFSVIFALMSSLAGFGLPHIYPQGERWLTDWQVTHIPHGPIDSSLVLVTGGEKRGGECGNGQWNLSVLDTAFLALHEAGARVLAPVIDVSLPIRSECGGLTGLVRLAEVTKRVGSVVYPTSVPPLLGDAAAMAGTLDLVFDEDGVFRGTKSPSSSAGSLDLPFGLAITALVSKLETATHSRLVSKLETATHSSSSEKLLRFGGRWSNAPFLTYGFADVWDMIQKEDREKLENVFQGKIIVFLSSESTKSSLSTPWDSDVPVEFLHVLLANAELTNAWLSWPPSWMVFLVTVGLGTIVLVLGLWKTSVARLTFLGLAGALMASFAFFLGLRLGWVWPLFSMGLALAVMIAGVMIWRTITSQSTVQERIAHGKQQLILLQEELVSKQGHVRELEGQLHDAQDHQNQSVLVIKGLQESQSRVFRRLQASQGEIEDTRRQIDRLEKELEDLHQQVPASQSLFPHKSLSVENEDIVQECESFRILTRDPTVLGLFHDLKKSAGTRSPLLLLGETGTGKEVFAKAAHALSSRRQGPFVSVNMAAIRSELFEGELFGHVKGAFTGAVGRTGFLETANGGTLFLDEVGELPPDVQAKLLRVLEDGSFHRVGQSRLTQVDVRIIAATNRDLLQEVKAGRYREDLYYRLRSIVLRLPPLSARGEEDIRLLAQFFLQEFAKQYHQMDLAFTQGALDAMVAYRWPGNIRELRQTVAQAVALANTCMITEADLHLDPSVTPSVRGEGQGKEEWRRSEDSLVLDCLRRHGFDMQATAKTLRWDRSTVTQRLKGLGFQALVEYQGNVQAAAQSLAGDVALSRVVEARLHEYSKNLLPSSKYYSSAEEAIVDCRKRFRNLPERHFPAVEWLIQRRFSTQSS
jgi:transcriptional regulator with PAS, ATPase and Fis domain